MPFICQVFSFQYSCGLIFPCTILNKLSARSSLNNFTPGHCYNSISFYSISSQKPMIATEVYFHHSSFYQQPFDGLGSNYTTLILTVGSTVEPATKYSRRQIQPQVESCVWCPLLLNMQPNNLIQPLYKFDACLPSQKRVLIILRVRKWQNTC